MITKISTPQITDKLFYLSCTESFSNNQSVNTSIIDTLEEHIIDFSSSNNVMLNTSDYSITLTDPTKNGYFITKSIHPHNLNSLINNFYILANFSTKTYEVNDIEPTIRFYIVTDKGEEFEINHIYYNALVLLNSVKFFYLKCSMTPSNNNVSPVVYGYSVHFKDSSIFDINTTNIRK